MTITTPKTIVPRAKRAFTTSGGIPRTFVNDTSVATPASAVRFGVVGVADGNSSRFLALNGRRPLQRSW